MVQFPDDDRLAHSLYFREQGLEGKVAEYFLAIGGVAYPVINEEISLNHSTIGDFRGIQFWSSGIPLRSLTITVVVVYDLRVLKTNLRISSQVYAGESFQLGTDYEAAPPLVLIDSFRKLSRNSRVTLQMSVAGEYPGGSFLGNA